MSPRSLARTPPAVSRPAPCGTPGPAITPVTSTPGQIGGSMTIAAADLLPILNSMGIMANDMDALQGTTPGAQIITAAGNNSGRILALTVISDTKDLAAGFDSMEKSASAPPGTTGSYLSKSALFSAACSAIQRHVSSLNTYLTSNN